MLTTREFHGVEFYGFCQGEFDKSRRFLKTCGRPKDDADRLLIDYHRDTSRLFGRLLDMTDAANEIQKRNELSAERIYLLRRVAAIDAILTPNDQAHQGETA